MKSTIIFGKVEDFICSINLHRTIFLVDHNIRRLYSDFFVQLPKVIEIEATEEKKNLQMVEFYLSKLKKLLVDRQYLLIGVGGGITTDIAGFIASIYMRGLNFVFVPTTLMAMVDASIGGKNGVNAFKIKNLIGTISQPQRIIIDLDYLVTLKNEHFLQGMAEVIKHAIIEGEDFMEYLETNAFQINERSQMHLEKIIAWSIQLKNQFVEADEKDHNIRHVLNMGHTLAHAFEILTELPHGYCVAVGLYIESCISHQLGLCDKSFVLRVKKLLQKYNLPTSFFYNTDDLMNIIRMDKKNHSKQICFVLPKCPGEYQLFYFGEYELTKILKNLYYE